MNEMKWNEMEQQKVKLVDNPDMFTDRFVNVMHTASKGNALCLSRGIMKTVIDGQYISLGRSRKKIPYCDLLGIECANTNGDLFMWRSLRSFPFERTRCNE